jgi:hypothetical protein
LNLIVGNWIEVPDGDPRAVGLYRRHYSAHKYNHGIPIDYVAKGFSGIGESMILLTSDGRALFGWRKQKISDAGQIGVNCFVFRLESKEYLASGLIKEADEMAWDRWPGERLYTYVNSKKIRSTNPGFCFLQAGWRRCGLTKGGLVILEIKPDRKGVGRNEW